MSLSLSRLEYRFPLIVASRRVKRLVQSPPSRHPCLLSKDDPRSHGSALREVNTRPVRRPSERRGSLRPHSMAALLWDGKSLCCQPCFASPIACRGRTLIDSRYSSCSRVADGLRTTLRR